MSYQTEFPDFKLDVEIPQGWEDTSWHNNTCPSFAAALGNSRVAHIFVDYATPADREIPECERFSVNLGAEDDVGDVILGTDDWQEVLAKVTDLQKGN